MVAKEKCVYEHKNKNMKSEVSELYVQSLYCGNKLMCEGWTYYSSFDEE
jgi:hypothetical protein